MYPRSSDDTAAWDRGVRTNQRVQFNYSCDGLVRAIKDASRAGCAQCAEDDESRAVWLAVYLVRQAKRLGLISEPVDVEVLVRMDVEAGEVA